MYEKHYLSNWSIVEGADKRSVLTQMINFREGISPLAKVSDVDEIFGVICLNLTV